MESLWRGRERKRRNGGVGEGRGGKKGEMEEGKRKRRGGGRVEGKKIKKKKL